MVPVFGDVKKIKMKEQNIIIKKLNICILYEVSTVSMCTIQHYIIIDNHSKCKSKHKHSLQLEF